MSKILNFIASMFIPRGLKAYRNMTGFIAFMIFLLEINLLYLPIKGVLLRNVDDSLNNSAYTIIFNNIEDTFNKGIEGIKESDYYINLNEDIYKLKTKNPNELINVYDYQYTYSEETYKVYYVFDVNNVIDDEIGKIFEKYKQVYPETEETLMSYISMLIYIDNPQDDNEMLAKMEYYSKKTSDEIISLVNSLTYFDLYEIQKTDKSYLLVFMENNFLAEVPAIQEGQFARMVSNYSNIELEMENISNINQFSKIFAHKLGEILAEEESVYYFTTCIIYVLLYPVIVAAILNVCLKNKGCLKSFKEFYNVLSIISIVPAIIGFALTFLVGTGGAMIYSAILSIYGIIMTYKVIKVTD